MKKKEATYSPTLDGTEKRLIENIRGGDKSAFELVFKKYFSVLCYFSLRYIPDKDVAEDLVQEMFFKLWNNRKNLFITTSLESYLYRSVQNQAINFIKHEKIKGKYRQVITESGNKSNNDELLMLNFDIKEKVEKAINALPEKRKEVFVLSRYEGKKYKEIAEKLKISIKTVEVHMGQALKQLRKDLKDIAPTVFLLAAYFFS
ncbi:MAG: RNA polymerase sigma-70 factor [Bacteroidota bacterium]|nr:RNA polymerase sigma-70 factor [Bacteroidota bacterium]